MKKTLCILAAVLTLVSAVSLASAGGYGRPYSGNPPAWSPMGTEQIGEIVVEWGASGDRKILKKTADPDSRWAGVVYPGRSYPCYAAVMGVNNKPWYYVWVPEDNVWGWASSAYSYLVGCP